MGREQSGCEVSAEEGSSECQDFWLLITGQTATLHSSVSGKLCRTRLCGTSSKVPLGGYPVATAD